MTYADPILGCSGVPVSGVTPGSYGPTADASPEAGGTISVPEITVDRDGRVTGAKSRTITLPAGGGGGGEENFEQVYTTTLDADSATVDIADLDGTYVDVLVYIDFTAGASTSEISADFYADTQMSNDGYIDSCFGTVTPGEAASCCLGVMSVAGMKSLSMSVVDSSGTLPSSYQSGFQVASGEILYPSTGKEGVAAIQVFVGGTGGGHVFPAGTTITVYARKAVQNDGE